MQSTSATKNRIIQINAIRNITGMSFVTRRQRVRTGTGWLHKHNLQLSSEGGGATNAIRNSTAMQNTSATTRDAQPRAKVAHKSTGRAQLRMPHYFT